MTVADKDTLPRPHAAVWHVMIVLAALMAFAGLSTDIYLPAMPEIADSFGVDHGAMEFTVTSFLIGLSLGQLVWGPISDKFGRMWPVVIGLGLFIIGTIGCALSSSVPEMVVWRVLQATGASASVVLSRAMIRDLYPGARGAQMMSLLIAVMTISPLIAPSIGAQVAGAFGWRAVFWVLGGIGIMALLGMLSLGETLAKPERNDSALGASFRAYAVLLCNRHVMAHALVVGLFYVGMFAYIAGTPAIFIGFYGLSPEAYGLVFGSGVVGIFILNLINGRIVARTGTTLLLRIGATATLAFGALIAVTAVSGIGGVLGFYLPLMGFVAMSGLIMPSALSGAMLGAGRNAGAIAALCGAIQYGGGIFGSALAGFFADGTPAPLGFILLAAGALTFAASLMLRTQRC
ncbi:multidrug effflux MFS transporter [Celeribacter litoreus]|uniref:multidrug effflux MFS transporter n=1 Tax=Celeribacter litoreus TaxID=2876714 RepID=UPI001CCB3517|nr:multidrug effflux MFS transporter [Celeribacter litoreus]MCA0043149.1 multidrug effflux MFS transporter [Celeribacter litoreus]